MRIVVFNRQLLSYLDGHSTGVLLDISRHTLLTKKWNQSHYDRYFVDFVRHQTSVPLIILSSVFGLVKKLFLCSFFSNLRKSALNPVTIGLTLKVSNLIKIHAASIDKSKIVSTDLKSGRSFLFTDWRLIKG